MTVHRCTVLLCDCPVVCHDEYRDVHGVSTYCGGLWLGALRAGAALALLLQKHDVAERWASMCTKARVLCASSKCMSIVLVMNE